MWCWWRLISLVVPHRRLISVGIHGWVALIVLTAWWVLLVVAPLLVPASPLVVRWRVSPRVILLRVAPLIVWIALRGVTSLVVLLWRLVIALVPS